MIHKLGNYFFRDLKLKDKFIVVNFLLVLIPTIVLATVIFRNMSSIITSNAIESETALVNQTADTLGEAVNRLRISVDSISTKRMMSVLTYAKDIPKYLKAASSSAEAAELFSEAKTLVDGDFITAIKIYLPDDIENMNQSFIQEHYPNNEIFSVESKIKGGYWHGIFNGMPELDTLLCPEFYLTRYEKEQFGKIAYIRKFENRNGEVPFDIYIAIYVNQEYFNSVFSHNQTGAGSVYYVVNGRNAEVATSDPGLSGMYRMRYEDIPDRIPEKGSFAKGNILGTDVFLVYQDIGTTDWRMVSVIPQRNVTGSATDLLRNIVHLYIIFLIMAFVLAISLSSSIAGRLSKIVRKMNVQKEHKTPDKIVDENGKDEIGQLVDNYNDMIERINNLMETQRVTAEKLKVSEVNALQAQINPHFLYNMLDMINWLSKAGKTAQASKSITTLSSFYKLTLSKKEFISTVGEELQHVGLYVELQNMRYEDKIELIVDVPEELYEIKIPKLIFQPIVENAIIHGIFELESKSGSIVITGWMEGEDVVFLVSDTGVGIAPEQIPLILKGEAKGTGSNIGIYNTHLRLQLIYGENYGLQYESTVGNGTDVEVRIRKTISENNLNRI